LKAQVTGGVKRGVPFNVEMKEWQRGDFFPFSGGGHGGDVRPAGGSGCLLYFDAGGGRKPAGPGRPKGRVGRLSRKAGGKSLFELKIRFLNL
jgi:hypothetical protein